MVFMICNLLNMRQHQIDESLLNFSWKTFESRVSTDFFFLIPQPHIFFQVIIFISAFMPKSIKNQNKITLPVSAANKLECKPQYLKLSLMLVNLIEDIREVSYCKECSVNTILEEVH